MKLVTSTHSVVQICPCSQKHRHVLRNGDEGDGESPFKPSGRGAWGHPQGPVHTAAARLRDMVGTEWANSRPGYVNKHRNATLIFWGVNFWQGRLLGV